MNGDLELLLKLQNIDYDLGELERSKEYIPDMMDNLRREIDDSRQRLELTREGLSKAQLEQKDAELQLTERQERLRKLQERMMAIKTNKEYDALVSEIDQVKREIGTLENRAMELMGFIENHEKEIRGYVEKAEAVAGANTEQLNSLQQQIDSVGNKVDEKTHERHSLVSQISKQTMLVYERIHRGKGGAVVVSVKKRACGACYKALPPQRIQEIKIGDRIITCDSCGRMLVWTSESDA
ncbi:MAG: C4-type zinc ribbon domain-containing protein [candidate division Zixibacteria bacterium]|nr:C4-type zinc ribbon domain-containing protein [candidate division Zixibacteria bacterium]